MDLSVTYRRWNDAIRRYLFEHNEDQEEVYLYITSEVLDEISNLNPKDQLGGHVGFETCVKDMFYHEDRRRSSRLLQLWKDILGTRPTEKFLDYSKKNSIFECALCFTQPEINKVFPCGYLNILAYGLLKLNHCPEEEESSIGKYLIKTAKEDLKGKENGKNYPISDLFAHLSKHYPAFKDISLNGYPYVGRLRYQLILTPSQIVELRDLLYTRCITASTDSYEATVNKIHGYASVNMKILLEKSLESSPYRHRIQNVFSNFDFDTYVTSLESSSDSNIQGTLRHALYFDETGCRPILLSDICNVNLSCHDSKGDLISLMAEPNDRLCGLNPNHVLRNGNDRFNLDETVTIEDGNLILSTKKDNGIWLLEECNNGQYYIESADPAPHKSVYVVINARCIGNLETLLDSSKSKLLYDPDSNDGSQLIPNAIGSGRFLYECPGSAIKTRQTSILRIHDARGSRSNKINRRGGILHPTRLNEYLVNALPEYLFPTDINTECINLKITTVDNRVLDHGIFLSDNNGIIIDIRDFSIFDTKKATRLELEFDFGGKEPFKDTLYVIMADGNFIQDSLKRLDVWGHPVDSQSPNDLYAWGGKQNSDSINKRLMAFSTTMYKLKKFQDLFDHALIDFNSYYLINLLAAIGLSDDNMIISRSRLKDCILMAAIRNSLAVKEEYPEETDRFIKTTVSSLINLGYILPLYGEGKTTYQVLPPMFVKTHAPVSIDSKGGEPYVWMLMGCYTRGFFEQLISNHKEQLMASDDSYFTLVRSRLVLHHTFDPEEFCKKSGYKCIFVDYDLVSAILSNLPSVDNYISTLTEIKQFGVSLMPTEKSECPRVRESAGYVFRKTRYIEKEPGVFFESNVSDPGWMFLAEAKMRRSSDILLNSLALLRPTYIRFPSILERVLGMMNVNAPERIRAFMVDSKDDRHALFCDYIRYGLVTDDGVIYQLKRIFGESEYLYADVKIQLGSNLTLYTSHERFSASPIYALVYSVLKEQIDLVAYWFGWNANPLVYVANAGYGFVKVDMTGYGDGALGINKLLSSLLKDKNSFGNIPALPNSHIKSLPYSLEGYFSTKLEVILKK